MRVSFFSRLFHWTRWLKVHTRLVHHFVFFVLVVLYQGNAVNDGFLVPFNLAHEPFVNVKGELGEVRVNPKNPALLQKSGDGVGFRDLVGDVGGVVRVAEGNAARRHSVRDDDHVRFLRVPIQ